MILRRLASAIRRQDGFTVVIEILIVVLGVFLGLQVNNWNAARQDRVDEALFMLRLHDDLQYAEALTARLRGTRLRRAGVLNDATDVVFGRKDDAVLDVRECGAIAFAHFFNFAAPELPSVMELLGSGRSKILSDVELRLALVRLQQAREALVLMVGLQTQRAIDLPSEYPDLIQADVALDPQTREVVTQFKCDLARMRQNQKFLNDLASARGRNDAFLRDAMAPWSRQFDDVHSRVDRVLGVTHEVGSPGP